MRKLTAGIGLATIAVPAVVAAQASPWGSFRAYSASDEAEVRAMWQSGWLDSLETPEEKVELAQWTGCMATARADGVWEKLHAKALDHARVIVNNGRVIALIYYDTNPTQSVLLRDDKKFGQMYLLLFNPALCKGNIAKMRQWLGYQMILEMQRAGYDGATTQMPWRLDSIPGYKRTASALGLETEVIGTDSTTGEPSQWRLWIPFSTHLPLLTAEMAGAS
jgi:hypothetical protein